MCTAAFPEALPNFTFWQFSRRSSNSKPCCISSDNIFLWTASSLASGQRPFEGR